MKQHETYQLVAGEDGRQRRRWRWADLSLVAVLVMAGSLMFGCADEDSDVPGQPAARLAGIRAPITSRNAQALVGRTFTISAQAFNNDAAPFPVALTFLSAPTTITRAATATAAGLLTGGTFRAVHIRGNTATGTWATNIPPTNKAIPVAANLFFTVATTAGGTSTFPAGSGLGLNEGAGCTSTTFCTLLISVSAGCNGGVDSIATMTLVFGPQAVLPADIPGVTVGETRVVTSSPLTTVNRSSTPLLVPMTIDAGGNVFVSEGHIDLDIKGECF